MSNQPVVNVSFPFIAGANLRLDMMVAIEWFGYQPGEADREIVVKLIGPHEIVYQNEAADEFKLYFDQMTGQGRIQAPPPGLKVV